MSRRASLLALGSIGLVLADAGRAAACTTCYGQAGGPLIDAARLGIWLLLGVTLCVQGGFVAFFLYLRRRAALAARAEGRQRLEAASGPGAHAGAEGFHG